MPLPEDFNHAKFIHDNRHLIAEKLEKRKKERAARPRTRRDLAVVFMAGVNKRAQHRTKDKETGEIKAVFPEPEIEVYEMKVTGGHKKPTSIKNLMRQGKFPVGYDFPTDAQLAAMRASAASSEGTIGRDLVASALEEDPYRAIRAFVERQIDILMSDWKVADGEKKVTGLQSKLEEQSAKTKEQEEEINRLRAMLAKESQATGKTSKQKKTKTEIEENAGTSQ